MNHAIWQNAELLQLFLTLLLMANYEESEFVFDGKPQKLERGQLITGRNKLAQLTGIKAGSIHRHLKTLENFEILSIKSSSKFSLITIVKYDDYQDYKKILSSKVSHTRATREQHVSNTRAQSNTVNTNNTLLKREDTEPTPKEKTVKFFTEAETQDQVIRKLGERGIPEQLAKAEVGKFVSYWTELNSTGTKQRWQMQETFEINKRLLTWFSKIQVPKVGGTRQTNAVQI